MLDHDKNGAFVNFEFKIRQTQAGFNYRSPIFQTEFPTVPGAAQYREFSIKGKLMACVKDLLWYNFSTANRSTGVGAKIEYHNEFSSV